MKLLYTTIGILFFTETLSAQEAPLWRCSNPVHPFRYVSSDDKKNDPPPCREWMQIRGPNLAALLDDLASERHTAANVFLAEAGQYATYSYPQAAKGLPVTTAELYRSPGAFGFEVAELEQAPVGSLVVYNGLGGIVVEVRQSENEPWIKQILYPSEAAGYRLMIGDLAIPGKMEARVLIASDRS